jgi:hypothetical protein
MVVLNLTKTILLISKATGGRWLGQLNGSCGDQANVSEPDSTWNLSATDKVSTGIVENTRTHENIRNHHDKRQAADASNLPVDGAEPGRSSAAAR